MTRTSTTTAPTTSSATAGIRHEATVSRAPHPEASALSGVSRTGWDWVPARVAEDFAAGRVVSVDGWQLSETEARLCAALPAA